LPQTVQTLTYEKICIGLELFLRLARELFEQPAWIRNATEKVKEKTPMAVDMSPEAVTARLKKAEELGRLCIVLGKAKPADAPTDKKQTSTPGKENAPG
jgi:hypothetical protein